MHERYSTQYFHTLTGTPLPLDAPAEMAGFTRYWGNLGLFVPYEYGNLTGPQFGFVAGRSETGFWITGRGSNKIDQPLWSHVSEVDFKQRTLTVHNNKASLNAPLAARIFGARPDIRYIVHFHFPLPSAFALPHDTAPGTLEDAIICDALPHNIFYQPHHGSLVLLHSLEEWIPLLLRESVYQAGAHNYNRAYARFLQQNRFSKFVRTQARQGAKAIGDIGCGTGESTRSLLLLSPQVTLIEPSAVMLAEACKTHPQLKHQNASASTFTGEFDLLVMRQAFNYILPNQYGATFRHIFQHLASGGSFIFNTFSPLQPDQALKVRHDQDNNGGHTAEGSLLEGDQIHHLQTLVSPQGNVMDYNQFFNTNVDLIRQQLEAAGFSVQLEQESNSLYFSCTRN